MNKLNKIYILSIALSVIMIALLLPACQKIMINSLNFNQHQCCAMKEMGNITYNHISYFKQFLMVNHIDYGDLFLVFIVLFVLVVINLFNLSNINLFKSFYKRQKIFNMKPWDPLRLALAQGIIHNKHLD